MNNNKSTKELVKESLSYLQVCMEENERFQEENERFQEENKALQEKNRILAKQLSEAQIKNSIWFRDCFQKEKLC